MFVTLLCFLTRPDNVFCGVCMPPPHVDTGFLRDSCVRSKNVTELILDS